MDEADRYEIAALAEAYETARLRFEMLGMMNRPTDPQERMKQSAEYHIADAERMQAWAMLDEAKSRISLKRS